MRTDNTNTSQNPPSKKRKKKRVSILKVLLLMVMLLIVTGSAVALGLVFAIVKSAQPINVSNIENMLDESSFIYDTNGKLIEKVHSADSYRSVVSLDQIPLYLQEAVIAIEDERFRDHNGIDIKRVGGALYYDIKTKSLAQGASTITMQLAKNLYTSPKRDLTRKIKDAYYALEIEKHMSKDQILHIYLNTIALGRGTNGVEAAAQTYFSKSVSELNLAECAMIAGITKYPSRYSPYNAEKISPDEAMEDLEIVILAIKDSPVPTEEDMVVYDKLYAAGKIDKFNYSLLKKGDIFVRKAVLNPESKARQEVVLKKMLELGKINAIEYEEAVNQPIVIKIGKKKETGLSSYFIDKLKEDVIDAIVEKGYTEDEALGILYNGGLRIYSTLNTEMQRNLEHKFETSKNFLGSFVDENGLPQPQGAMVIMENSTGAVRALIGGRGIGGNRIYNRALNPRQPGSSIKPIAVYLPAMINGRITAATVINDSPRKDGKGGYWPKNVGRYFGPSSIRTMIEHSSNVVAVKVAESFAGSEQAGIHTIIKSLQNLGISTIVTRSQNARVNDENLSLVLGGMTKGVTPLDITAAYTVFSNKGVVHTPIFFTRIENSNGDVIIENNGNPKKITDEQTAYVMTDILRTAVLNGSGKAAKLSNMSVAGKTGTTTDQKDVWFVGFTPYYTAATWIGTDMPQPLVEGSNMPARLWKEVMEDVHAGYENKEFDRPDGIVEVTVCKRSGQLLTKACVRAGSGRTEIFKAGTEPTDYCYVHSNSSPPPSTLAPSPETPSEPSAPTDPTSQFPNSPPNPLPAPSPTPEPTLPEENPTLPAPEDTLPDDTAVLP